MIISNDKELYFKFKQSKFHYFGFLNSNKTQNFMFQNLAYIDDKMFNIYEDISAVLSYMAHPDAVYSPYVGVVYLYSKHFDEVGFCPVVQTKDPDNRGDYETDVYLTPTLRTYNLPINISIQELFFTEDIIKWEQLYSRY